MLTAAAQPFRGPGLPDRDDYCPRCETRIEQIVRIAVASVTATGIVSKADADAVAVEADRLARVELAKAGGCRG